MNFTCLSVCRQGWLGVPLFFLGLASLAFSQLVQDAKIESLPPDQQIQFIDSKLKDLSKRIEVVVNNQRTAPFEIKKRSATGNLNQLISVYGKNNPSARSVQKKLSEADSRWDVRSAEINQGVSSIQERLNEANLIFQDLKDNFAGRLDEASPALNILQQNLVRSETEVNALSGLSENALSEAMNSYSNIQIESNELVVKAVPSPPSVSNPRRVSSTQTSQVADAIKAKEAVPLRSSDRFSPAIDSDAAFLQVQKSSPKSSEPTEVINRLKSELAVSKSVQTELSADTADLQGDLRKAYREIVSLQNNLKESQLIVQELETTKNSLWQTGNGQYPSAQSVSGRIKKLESELELAREDLRASRQTLLIEQERSNAMIRSVTNELERTRRDLDAARAAATSAGADSTRLATLERELNEARRSLQMAKMAPMDSTQETYLTLQNELRQALGEITRMQIELGEKDELEAQLVKLRSSMEGVTDSSTRPPSSEYVNKLLIDLNAAKGEVEKAKSANRDDMKSLVEKVASLEDKLKISDLELRKTKALFDETKESIARREFEYATTIQRLDEDAQNAQNSLRDASLGKLPAIPFVDEMERNLAESESRIKDLSDRFESEQSKATELIDGLQIELDSAVVRQKRALDQLARREIDLEDKDLELNQAKEEAKKLKEELAVVKVIAGQLEDLNSVLEQTKMTQNSQSGSMDQVVASLKEELNQAKVELVFALEEGEKQQINSSKRINSLEFQLEDMRNQLLAEQENLSDHANDSKELVLDLKQELDAARTEISRMKTAGLGDSVETNQAVAQLQEALGTIRILQESLDESEKVNLEVDNLRSELANAMESQLTELQRLENEKASLQQKTVDLESEISLLRNEGLGTGIKFQKSNTELVEQLKVSQLQIAELEKRSALAENAGVLSLVDLEEELANERQNNQELEQALAKASLVKEKTVSLLEDELATALQKLDNLEGSQSNRDLKMQALQKELLNTKKLLNSSNDSGNAAGDEQLLIVSQLEDQLTEAQDRLSEIENLSPRTTSNETGNEAILLLDNELGKAEETITSLQIALDAEDSKRNLIQTQLDDALMRLGNLEKTDVPEVQRLKSLLAAKEKEQAILESELQTAISALDQNDGEVSLANSVGSELQSLRRKLEVAENNLRNKDNVEVQRLKSLLAGKDKELALLESELRNAISTLDEKDGEIVLSDSISSEIETLQRKLEIAEEKLRNRSVEDPEDILRLDNELEVAQKTIQELLAKTKFEEAARMEIEDDLSIALNKLDEMNIQDTTSSPSVGGVDSDVVDKLKKLLSEKELKQRELEEELSNAISVMTEKEAELEIVGSIKEEMLVLKEQLNNAEKIAKGKEDNSPNEQMFTQTEMESLQSEVDLLKTKLADAKKDSSAVNSDKLLSDLQEQLQVAVAESVEMQTELEETKARIFEMEANNDSLNQRPDLQKLLDSAKNAEAQAEDRIMNLTQSLRNSEGLRKEMELLLAEFQNVPQPQKKNYAEDPRFIDMQNELVLLQQDLLAVRDLDNPKIQELQFELQSSQNDSAKLNDEFKGAMEDFGKIKEQVAILEEENTRLQNRMLGDVRNQNMQVVQKLEGQLNNLSKENANLRIQLGEKETRVSGLREKLAQAQLETPGVSPDNAALRSQVVRLEGLLQGAQDAEQRAANKANLSLNEIQSLNQNIVLLEERLREAESAARGVPSRLPSFVNSNQPNIDNSGEVLRLREQVNQLESQLQIAKTIPNRNQLDRKIRDLNQKNLTAQIQLDQERARVEDLKGQLSDALGIKQEVLERGQSANIKVSLLNNELADAKKRISSLESTLIAAREAIRVLNKGSNSSTMQVSIPSSRSFGGARQSTYLPQQNQPSFNPTKRMGQSPNRRTSSIDNYRTQSSFPSPIIQQIPQGDSSIQLRAQVQFLNNKNRPAGFTEFFLVKEDLESIVSNSGIRIPPGQGIDSGAELWARSVQRGYRFPGVASAIRNALATRSLARIKTNSMGEANLANIEAGNYYVVGSSSLGQVGIVWSKPFQLRPGSNSISLDLRDAAWAE
jgi:chromosome segregation ATPase